MKFNSNPAEAADANEPESQGTVDLDALFGWNEAARSPDPVALSSDAGGEPALSSLPAASDVAPQASTDVARSLESLRSDQQLESLWSSVLESVSATEPTAADAAPADPIEENGAPQDRTDSPRLYTPWSSLAEAPETVDPVECEGSPVATDVAAAETWRDALVRTFAGRDRHVSDDEIFAMLNANVEAEGTSEMFAAKGVTMPMYCVWKTKYRGMSVEELAAARRREMWRARGVLGAVVIVGVLGAGGMVIGLARATSIAPAAPAAPATPGIVGTPAVAPLPEPAPAKTPAVAAPVASGNGSAQPANAATRQASSGQASAGSNPASSDGSAAAGPEASAAASARASAASGPPAPATETGFRIQVAAANSLPEGRAIVERLASAGYPAYLLPAVVGNAEVFRVRVGPFDTLPAAEEIAALLKRDGYPDAWIAR